MNFEGVVFIVVMLLYLLFFREPENHKALRLIPTGHPVPRVIVRTPEVKVSPEKGQGSVGLSIKVHKQQVERGIHDGIELIDQALAEIDRARS